MIIGKRQKADYDRETLRERIVAARATHVAAAAAAARRRKVKQKKHGGQFLVRESLTKTAWFGQPRVVCLPAKVEATSRVR